MNTSGKKSDKIALPVTMAVIPAVLTLLEVIGLLMTFFGGAPKSIPGLYLVAVASLLGLFALPFFCLIFEVIGLISSIRRRKKVLIVITIVEIVITVLAAGFSVLFFNFAVRA